MEASKEETKDPFRIEVEIKGVYGKKLYYPSCPKSYMFAKIAGATTLTTSVLHQINLLGYHIDIKREELPEFGSKE